jgi:hypothetical protein
MKKNDFLKPVLLKNQVYAEKTRDGGENFHRHP